MKKILIGFLIFSIIGQFLFASQTEAYVSVKGYYRSNGTYVAPHVRSNPNGLKYDNYGYKPSQGLYNPSYGTKGTTWDTPTYITDPNYYTGKSLYDNKQTVIPAASTENNKICTSAYINSGWNGTYSSDGNKIVCACNTGYSWNSTKTGCVSNETNNKICYNAYANSSWDKTYSSDGGKIVCDCNSGYSWNSPRTACVVDSLKLANQTGQCDLQHLSSCNQKELLAMIATLIK
jgi:hypothetical protein